MQTVRDYHQQEKPVEKKKSINHNFSAFAGVIEQYASEAAFLWLLREQALTSPLYVTTDIIDLEQRIEGSLRGLSTAGEHGWLVCVDQLAFEEAGEVFTAAVVALRSRNAKHIKMVCELALKSQEMTRGLVSAFGWIEIDIARFWIQRFLAVSDPVYKSLGLAICSVKREFPDKQLITILQDPATNKLPAVHARALRLIGELKRWELVPALNAAMEAEDDNVRFWANWSAAILGNPAAVKNLLPWVLSVSDNSERAVQLVFSLLPVPEARAVIAEMVKKPEMSRLSMMAIGVLGDPQAVPWLIQMMAKPELARLSGWAFSQITGIDLEATHLVDERAANAETGPTDDTEDENVAMDADEDLAWPDKNKVERLWQVHNRLLQAGHRYFQGQEINRQLLDQIYVNANQQQKQLAALQRAVYDKHADFVNIRERHI